MAEAENGPHVYAGSFNGKASHAKVTASARAYLCVLFSCINELMQGLVGRMKCFVVEIQ
jgi:hypothetical protein